MPLFLSLTIVQFFSSNKKKPVLLLNGYSDRMDKMNSIKKNLVEMHLKRMQTSVISATTRMLQIPKKKQYTQKMIGDLRSKALSSTVAPRHIISEITRILIHNILPILPEYITLQRIFPKSEKRQICPIISQEVPPISIFPINLKIHSEKNH
ncbi:hypothetical protein HZS_4187 [Henneguya salminicola]|nr:hypothetical protein HZS_4187 [Henneguya salminicola]